MKVLRAKKYQFTVRIKKNHHTTCENIKFKDNFTFILLYYDWNQDVMLTFDIAHFVKDVRTSKCMTHTDVKATGSALLWGFSALAICSAWLQPPNTFARKKRQYSSVISSGTAAREISWDKNLEKYKWEIRHFDTFLKTVEEINSWICQKAVESPAPHTFKEEAAQNFLKSCSDTQAPN